MAKSVKSSKEKDSFAEAASLANELREEKESGFSVDSENYIDEKSSSYTESVTEETTEVTKGVVKKNKRGASKKKSMKQKKQKTLVDVANSDEVNLIDKSNSINRDSNLNDAVIITPPVNYNPRGGLIEMLGGGLMVLILIEIIIIILLILFSMV